jgi:hypothetical protein
MPNGTFVVLSRMPDLLVFVLWRKYFCFVDVGEVGCASNRVEFVLLNRFYEMRRPDEFIVLLGLQLRMETY